ncbi:DinB family protein [Halalkalibacterium halodurans]|jgi:uncharacterized damage-inducible protein DinB|uniref:DinB family protein n=1 Tax=Halalkalibacterium halodurans TaxID=86665 RepID=UPI002AAA3985|nr:DinB family protein [Halalkalibacterium halodurans]MDY7222449.1 DinB family protein [Halalkalibacterium halodurans]MDY7241670.1 DinB family protein [Halalkalibacterium halodurans]
MYTKVTQFLQEWKEEAAITEKVIAALTDESLDKRFSENGRTLRRLAWHISQTIPEYLTEFGFELEEVEMPANVPTKAKEIADYFRMASKAVSRSAEQRWTDESLSYVQDAWGEPLSKAELLSLFIKHMIHHRGQMTVLMRQAGVKVPGCYGPSFEEGQEMGFIPEV